MQESDTIQVSGRGTGVDIAIDDTVPFEIAERSLLEYLDLCRGLYSRGTVSVNVGRRILAPEQLSAIKDILDRETGLTVTRYWCAPEILEKAFSTSRTSSPPGGALPVPGGVSSQSPVGTGIAARVGPAITGDDPGYEPVEGPVRNAANCEGRQLPLDIPGLEPAFVPAPVLPSVPPPEPTPGTIPGPTPGPTPGPIPEPLPSSPFVAEKAESIAQHRPYPGQDQSMTHALAETERETGLEEIMSDEGAANEFNAPLSEDLQAVSHMAAVSVMAGETAPDDLAVIAGDSAGDTAGEPAAVSTSSGEPGPAGQAGEDVIGPPPRPGTEPGTEPGRRPGTNSHPTSRNEALFIKATCRSGEVIQYFGDVVVFGDVNPGAEIIAGGDVVVLGALRGTVQAGAYGDSTATIFALNLESQRLQIGSHVGEAPARVKRGRSGNRSVAPQIAYLRRRSIFVAPFERRREEYQGGILYEG